MKRVGIQINKESLDVAIKGEEALNENNIKTAIKYFDQAIKIDSHNAGAYYKRARCHYLHFTLKVKTQKAAAQAIADWSAYLLITEPTKWHRDAIFNKGLVHYELRNFQEAKNNFTIFIDNYDTRDKQYLKRVYKYRSECFVVLKDYEKALNDSIKVLDFDNKKSRNIYDEILNVIELKIMNYDYEGALDEINNMEQLQRDISWLETLEKDETIYGLNSTQYAFRSLFIMNYFHIIVLRLLQKDYKQLYKDIKRDVFFKALRGRLHWNTFEITKWLKKSKIGFYDRRFISKMTKKLIGNNSISKEKPFRKQYTCLHCEKNGVINNIDYYEESIWAEITRLNDKNRIFICKNCQKTLSYNIDLDELVEYKKNITQLYKNYSLDKIKIEYLTKSNLASLIENQKKVLEKVDKNKIDESSLINNLGLFEPLFSEPLDIFDNDYLPKNILDILKHFKQKAVTESFFKQVHQAMKVEEQTYYCVLCDEDSSHPDVCTECGNDM